MRRGSAENVAADFTGVGSGRGREHKVTVVGLIERGGRARMLTAADVTKETIGLALPKHVDRDTHLMTDKSPSYPEAASYYRAHSTLDHSREEYARREGDLVVIEGAFGNLKRAINSIYHHVRAQYVQQYLGESCFRYSVRATSDGERSRLAMRQGRGKRLALPKPKAC